MNYIQTYTGKQVDPFELQISDICIEDIAHSLALQCRFNGHCREFYSVAEHCCRVSDVCPEHLKSAGLLHDDSEAYLCDLPTPLKNNLPQYKEVEKWVEKKIGYRFGAGALTIAIGDVIEEFDLTLLATEGRDLMHEWVDDLSSLEEIITPWSWKKAESEFLLRAKEFGLI